MINVKKRKKEKRVDRRDIFARSFSFLWAETTRDLDFFFWKEEQGKNDFKEKERFYPEEDSMKTMRTTFYTSSWHQEKREQKRSQTKKKEQKKRRKTTTFVCTLI